MKERWQILVIDDEEVMRESLAAWLREDGYTVDTAQSGLDGVSKRAAEGIRDLLHRPQDAGRHGRASRR
jgi:CheY-like chemotaxis protein